MDEYRFVSLLFNHATGLIETQYEKFVNVDHLENLFPNSTETMRIFVTACNTRNVHTNMLIGLPLPRVYAWNATSKFEYQLDTGRVFEHLQTPREHLDELKGQLFTCVPNEILSIMDDFQSLDDCNTIYTKDCSHDTTNLVTTVVIEMNQEHNLNESTKKNIVDFLTYSNSLLSNEVNTVLNSPQHYILHAFGISIWLEDGTPQFDMMVKLKRVFH